MQLARLHECNARHLPVLIAHSDGDAASLDINLAHLTLLVSNHAHICALTGSNATTGQMFAASGVFSWEPVCERLESDMLYRYQGRHKLDQFAACFAAVDSGARSAWDGQLVSPPACVTIAVLRCTKPTIRMLWSSQASNLMTFTPASTYVVPVATNISIGLAAADDTQTLVLALFHRADPGIPSTGARWSSPACTVNSTLQVSCNPVQRNFSFSAGLEHAGTRYPICFEATNDQILCPAFRNDTTPAAYGVFTGAGIRPSQSSQPLCINVEVPGPAIQWIVPTPAQEETLTTYMGCLFAINLTARDATNYFDLDIFAFQVSSRAS
jgi:hypothetical protein